MGAISKEDYDFKWKKFLEAIDFVCVDTRLQQNGKPLDFVYFNRSQAKHEGLKEIPQKICFECPVINRKPLTLNELVALHPKRKFQASLHSSPEERPKRESVVFKVMTTQEEPDSGNCWSRLLAKLRLA